MREHDFYAEIQRVQSPVLSSDCLYNTLHFFKSMFRPGKAWIWSRCWEPPLDRGKIRIRWTCRCGTKLWDDFRELQPGAAERLQRSLKYCNLDAVERSRDTNDVAQQSDALQPPPTAHKSSGNIDLAITNNATRLAETGLPEMSRSGSTSVNDAMNTKLSPDDSQSLHKKYLLVCLSKRNDTLRLFQLSIEHIKDDCSLFQLLQRVYQDHRGSFVRFFSPWRLKSINFLKASQYVDIEKCAERTDNKSVARASSSGASCDTSRSCSPT